MKRVVVYAAAFLLASNLYIMVIIIEGMFNRPSENHSILSGKLLQYMHKIEFMMLPSVQDIIPLSLINQTKSIKEKGDMMGRASDNHIGGLLFKIALYGYVWYYNSD